MFHILEWKDQVACCSGMLQKEVAERLAAPPGTKARGILSVLLQAWYDVEYLFTVDEHVFNPPPKVKSGVVRLTRNGGPTGGEGAESRKDQCGSYRRGEGAGKRRTGLTELLYDGGKTRR